MREEFLAGRENPGVAAGGGCLQAQEDGMRLAGRGNDGPRNAGGVGQAVSTASLEPAAND